MHKDAYSECCILFLTWVRLMLWYSSCSTLVYNRICIDGDWEVRMIKEFINTNIEFTLYDQNVPLDLSSEGTQVGKRVIRTSSPEGLDPEGAWNVPRRRTNVASRLSDRTPLRWHSSSLRLYRELIPTLFGKIFVPRHWSCF